MMDLVVHQTFIGERSLCLIDIDHSTTSTFQGKFAEITDQIPAKDSVPERRMK